VDDGDLIVLLDFARSCLEMWCLEFERASFMREIIQHT
jgi:hypothetical protein